MAITISQTHAQIGIERMPGRTQMQSQNARLEMHQKHAKVNIETELPRVQIDQYEAFASAGLKNNADLLKDAVQRGYQQVMEYIGKIAADGDTLAAIEHGGNPIADISERDAYPEHEYGYDYLPKAGPKFDVTGYVKLDPEPNGQGTTNGVEFKYIPGNLNINYTPGKVDVFIKQYASINIKYIPESKMDIYV